MRKKTQKTNVNISQPSNKCFICGQLFGIKFVDMHMHSYFHHEAIEKIKGSVQLHQCWACSVTVMGLEQYKEHITTRKHQQNLIKLRGKRQKKLPLQVDYNIDLNDNELKVLCDLRKLEKKEHTNLYKCIICRHRFSEPDWDKHMHSFVHHQGIEKSKGSEQEHKCWACEMSMTGMAAFKKHIDTRYHKIKLLELANNRQLGKITVDYSMELEELIDHCAQSDQEKCQKNLDQCTICSHRFPEMEWDKHMHGIVHHQAIEQLKGSEHEHKCWACDMSVKGMARFRSHIGTEDHKRKLQKLVNNRKLGKNTMDYSVEFNELKDLCAQREQERFMKKKKKMKKWAEEHRRKTTRFLQIESTAENEQCTAPFMANDQLPPSCHFSSFEKNPNDHPPTIEDNQNLPTQREDGIVDMDRSNEPLMKRRCLERPSENIPQEMSAHGTHPKPDGKGTEVCANDMTPETVDGTAAEPLCAPGLVQSRMEASMPNSTAARGVCLTGNEAVILNLPLQKHTCSKNSTLKVNRAALQSEQGMTRKGTNGQEPFVDSLPPVSLLAEMFKSQTSENDLEIIENVRPNTVRVQKNKSNESDTEQRETSLEHHDNFEAISSNVQKTKNKDVSRDLSPEMNKISRKRKVNTLISLSLKEEELTSSLENVGEQLFQAYSTLQSAYSEVQRLLAVKQEVTSEMASLRAKRIEILQDMKNPDDQQEVLNGS
ncbi:uncharacterized protein znf106b isoform X2 [Labeo rohita]|uniref:uncharacterized protein znf106b isoform X2 n=1 Tax=Labeo rohita TaxID=84645 RepID=UPI0021E30C04|nr:uncharacterized protein znf106b isoform X2 [Labeo rohita]